MPDLATLSINIQTDAGDSEAKLAALQESADSADKSLTDLQDTAAKTGTSFSSLGPATEQAAASTQKVVDAADAAEQSLASLGDAATASSSSMASMEQASGAIDSNVKASSESFRVFSSAVGESSAAVEESAGKIVMHDLHMVHLTESLSKGQMNLRAISSVARSFSGEIEGLASTLGMSSAALIGWTIGLTIAAVEIVKMSMEANALDKAVSGMAQGVAAGSNITTESFKKFAAEAANSAGISVKSATDIGKAYMKTGELTNENMTEMITLTAQWAAATGTDIKAATEAFASAMEEPVAGLKKLNDQMYISDRALDQQVAYYTAAGDSSKAFALIQAQVSAAVGDINLKVSTLNTAWNEFKSSAETVAEGFAHIGVFALDAAVGIARATGEAILMVGSLGQVATGAGQSASAISLLGTAVSSFFGYVVTGAEYVDKFYGELAKSGNITQSATAALKSMQSATEASSKATDEHAIAAKKLVAELAPEGNEIAKCFGELKVLSEAYQKGTISAVEYQRATDKVHESLDKLQNVTKQTSTVAASTSTSTEKNITTTTTLAGRTEALAKAHADLLAAAKATDAQNGISEKSFKSETMAVEMLIKYGSAAGKMYDDLKTAQDGITEAKARFNSEIGKEVMQQQAVQSAYQKTISAMQSLYDANVMNNSAAGRQAIETQAQAHASDALTAALQRQADAKAMLTSYDGQQAAAINKATDALTSETKAANDNTAALNSDASAASNDAGAQSNLASAVSSGGGGGGGGGGSPGYFLSPHDLSGPSTATMVDAQATLANMISAITDKIQSLQQVQQPTAPNIAAGSTAATQPGAYGGDQNASFFYNPESRASFMGQFGIRGDAKTQQDERTYQLQQQQYQAAQAQISQLQGVLTALQSGNAGAMNWGQQMVHMLGLIYEVATKSGSTGTLLTPYGTVPPKPAYAAAGGAFMVQGQGGTDTNLVSMALTAGELVTVQTPNQQQSSGQSKNIIVNLSIATPNVASFQSARASIVNKTASIVAQALKQRQ